MPQKRPNSLLADFSLLYAAAIWGTTFYIVKSSLDAIHPLTLVGYRFLIAGLLLGIGLWIKRVPIKPSLIHGAILGFILWLLYVPQTAGLQFTSASTSAFITGLFIVFVPIFLPFFKKKPSKQRLVAVGIALIGLWFLTGGLKAINTGDLLTIITAMAYALHLLFVDKWVSGKGNPWALSFVQFMTVGLLSFALAPLTCASLKVTEPRIWGIILFLALLPTLSAFVIQMVAQKFTSPVKVALIFSMEPVFAAIYSWSVGGEQLIPIKAFGGAIIVAAMILSELPIKSRDACV